MISQSLLRNQLFYFLHSGQFVIKKFDNATRTFAVAKSHEQLDQRCGLNTVSGKDGLNAAMIMRQVNMIVPQNRSFAQCFQAFVSVRSIAIQTPWPKIA